MHARRTALIGIGITSLALISAHAFKITGTAPTVEFHSITNANFPGLQAFFQDKMNAEVKAAFNSSIDTANKAMSGFGSQKQLAQGMANANAYSSNSATMQGYGNYDLFAVSSGFMLGVQAPTLDLGAAGTMGKDITKKGDIYAGLGAGFTYLNVGINCSKFLLPGLYLNAKYGGMSMDQSDFSMDFKVFGVGASYRVLEPKSFIGLVKWRGLSASTGFYMQMDKLKYQVKPDTFKTDAKFREAVLSGATSAQDSTDKEAILTEMGYGKGSPDAQVLINPVFNMGLDVSTYTIPLEVNTAVALLWGVINLNAGVGMDLNFGSAKIDLEGTSDADIKGNSNKVTFTTANVNVEGGDDNGPSLARLRAMTGVGLGLGPVKIDVPIVYYVKSGFAFGVTGAVVW
jgi:hypothetical protein